MPSPPTFAGEPNFIIMKKLFTLVCIFTCMNAFSQQLFTLEKTLEGTFNFNYDYEEPGSIISLSLPAQKNVFYNTAAEISNNTVIYKFYDTDYNLITQEYSFKIPNNYKLSGVTKISIPGNSNQEWFVAILNHSNKTIGDSEYCRNIIYNSVGEEVYEFKSSSQMLSIFPMLYLINNKYKLLVWRYEYSKDSYTYTTYTDIYSINIEINNNAINSMTSRAIPITQVFNTNGVLIEETDKEISSQNFSKGIYIVRENNQTKKVLLGE